MEEVQLKPEFSKKKLFIIDLDGTVYHGEKLIPGADVTIKNLVRAKKEVVFLTNNASKTRKSFSDILNKMGVPCTPEQLFTSGYTAIKLLAEDTNIKSIYIVGSQEMIQMTEEAGLKTLNNFYSEEVLYAPFLEKSIKSDAVLCSWDVELTYAKIRTAMELIARGAEFYATNQDTTFPNSGQKWPGTGVIVAAVQTCVRKPPKIVFGKPNIYGIEIIFKYLNSLKSGIRFRHKDALVVGDRLETDIWQANNAGVDSLFVETGINKRSDIPQDPKTKEQKRLIPTFTLSHIKEMFQFSPNS